MSASPSTRELLVSADNEVRAQIRARLDAEARARVACSDLRVALRSATSLDARAYAAETANTVLARDVVTLVHRLRTLRAANASLLRRCSGARSEDGRRDALEAENAVLRTRLRAAEGRAARATDTGAASASDTGAVLGAEPIASCPSCAPLVDGLVRERDNALRERDDANVERDDALRERDAALRERDDAVREREAAAADHDAELLDVEATVGRLADEQARVEVVLRAAAGEKRELLARVRELEAQISQVAAITGGHSGGASAGGTRPAALSQEDASTPPRPGTGRAAGQLSPPPTQKVVRSTARTPLAGGATEMATPGDPSFPLPSPLRSYAALLDNVREMTARARAAHADES